MINCPYCKSDSVMFRSLREKTKYRFSCKVCKKYFLAAPELAIQWRLIRSEQKKAKAADKLASHKAAREIKKANFISDEYDSFMRNNELLHTWIGVKPSLQWYGLGAFAK